MQFVQNYSTYSKSVKRWKRDELLQSQSKPVQIVPTDSLSVGGGGGVNLSEKVR